MRKLVLTLLLTAALPACSKLDTNRTVDSYSSFGAIVYRESCQRVAYTGQLDQYAAGQIKTVDVSGSLGNSVCNMGAPPPPMAPPKLDAIVLQKSPIIAVSDLILPKGFLSTFETFLEQLLPLTDDGTMENAISKIADILGTMSKDPDFTPSLARLSLRNGYRPTNTAAGIMHAVVFYPGLDSFIGKTLSIIAKDGGSAYNEWSTLLTATSKALKSVQPVPNPADSQRTLQLALDLLRSTHPDLVPTGGTTHPLVQRDYRGLAVAGKDGNGNLVAPFVDMNGDGLADADANGNFVDAAGLPLTVATPFVAAGTTDTAPRDSLGRATVSATDMTPLYTYQDLNGTVFDGLAQETVGLMDPTSDKALGLVWGAGALLGPRAMKTYTYDSVNGAPPDTLTYNGFDTTQSAVLDLVHAYIQVLGDPNNTDSTLQIAKTLMSSYESPTARLVGAMLAVSDLGKQHTEATIPVTSDLYDDLMVILNRILAVDGLLGDLMSALDTPAVRDLAPQMARLMVANNQVDFDHTQSPDYPLLDAGADLDNISPVDRTKPDTDYNRSLIQRLAHLIHDANGVQFCNKDGATFTLVLPFGPYAKCKLFEIDDLALYFILNMSSVGTSQTGFPQTATDTSSIGDFADGANFVSHITDSFVKGTITALGAINAQDSFLQSQTGITGFKSYPTPAALTRSLFLRANEKSSFLAGTTDDVLDIDGDKFIDVHDKTLAAWEPHLLNPPSGVTTPVTFYTALQPIVDAFVKHEECLATDANGNCTKTQNAGKILVDLFAMLHTHWTSPQGSFFGHHYQSADPTKPYFSYADNVVSYEPLLNEVLGPNGDLMPALLDLAPTLNTMTVDGTANTPAARPFLIGTAKYLFQFGGASGLAYRNGATTTMRSDGTTPVKVITPYYMLADAYAHKRNALAAGDPNMAASWKSATSALVDQLLTVDKVTTTGATPSTHWQFHDRKFRAIGLIAIDWLRARLAAHTAAGDLDTWIHQTLTQDMTDNLGGPTFAALADFTNKVEADSDARTELYNLMQYLVTESATDPNFRDSLTALADQAQMFLDDPDLVPVARVMGAAMDPQNGAVDAIITLSKDAHDRDTAKALLTVLKNVYTQDPATGAYPASNLADILSALNRAQPSGSSDDLNAADYASILSSVQGFLNDNQRGFSRFMNIVKDRNGNN